MYLPVFAVAVGALSLAYGTSGDGPSSGVTGVIYLALGALTLRTCGRANPVPPRRGILPWLQIVALLAIAAFSAVDGLYFHHLVATGVPLWTPLRFTIFHEATRIFNDRALGSGIANATFYVVPPLIVLLALQVPPSSFGLGRFQSKSTIVAAIWLIPAVIAVTWGAMASGGTLPTLVHRVLTDLLQNGATEEFLWRGAILGRLRLFMRNDVAVLLQAVLFGLWHAGADISAFQGNIWLACAEAVAVQTTFGIAMGYVALRSGNIAVSSIFHALIDALP